MIKTNRNSSEQIQSGKTKYWKARSDKTALIERYQNFKISNWREKYKGSFFLFWFTSARPSIFGARKLAIFFFLNGRFGSRDFGSSESYGHAHYAVYAPVQTRMYVKRHIGTHLAHIGRFVGVGPPISGDDTFFLLARPHVGFYRPTGTRTRIKKASLI